MNASVGSAAAPWRKRGRKKEESFAYFAMLRIGEQTVSAMDNVYRIRTASSDYYVVLGQFFALPWDIADCSLFANEGKSKKTRPGGRSGGQLSIQLSPRNGRIRMNR